MAKKVGDHKSLWRIGWKRKLEVQLAEGSVGNWKKSSCNSSNRQKANRERGKAPVLPLCWSRLFRGRSDQLSQLVDDLKTLLLLLRIWSRCLYCLKQWRSKTNSVSINWLNLSYSIASTSKCFLSSCLTLSAKCYLCPLVLKAVVCQIFCDIMRFDKKVALNNGISRCPIYSNWLSN